MQEVECWFQCTGNDDGNVGMSQSLHQVGPQMLTEEQKEQNLHVCQDVLNQYKTGGDSFLKYIISGEETWHHPY